MTFDPEGWKNQPVQARPKPEQPLNGHKPLTESELDSLATLPPEELISLIKRICGAAGWLRLATLTEEELKAATRLRLAELALNCKDDKLALQAIGQLLDRLEGKPLQSVDLNAKIGIVQIVMEAGKRGKALLDQTPEKQ